MIRRQLDPNEDLLFDERYRGVVYLGERTWFMAAVEFGQFAIGFQIVRLGIVFLVGPFALGMGVRRG